jgi:hypothetical protein
MQKCATSQVIEISVAPVITIFIITHAMYVERSLLFLLIVHRLKIEVVLIEQ